jgi:hypothetical protein
MCLPTTLYAAQPAAQANGIVAVFCLIFLTGRGPTKTIGERCSSPFNIGGGQTCFEKAREKNTVPGALKVQRRSPVVDEERRD